MTYPARSDPLPSLSDFVIDHTMLAAAFTSFPQCTSPNDYVSNKPDRTNA